MSNDYKSVSSIIRAMRVPRAPMDEPRDKVKGLAHVARDIVTSDTNRREVKVNPYARQQEIQSKIIDENTSNEDLENFIIEAATIDDPDLVSALKKLAASSDNSESKKSVAVMIANNMARATSSNKDVKTLIIYLAALVMLSASDGKDMLLQVSRRLLSVGMSSHK